MIFDKRFVMATALVLGFGMAACGGDEDCSGNGTKGEDGKCTCNEGYVANEAGDDCVVKEDNGNGGGDEDCSGNGTKGEDGKCTCNEGYVANEAGDDCVVKEDNGNGNGNGEGEGNGEGNGEGETKTCDGENEEYNASAEKCVCKDGFYRTDLDDTKPCIAKPANCGNNTLDADEFCDKDADGNAIFKNTALTCNDYDATGTYAEDAKPGCNNDCTGIAKGSCNTLTCGNGIIDDGEICDKDSDGNTIWGEGVEHTCNNWQEGTYKEGGEPSCNINCKGYAKGTCEADDGGSEDTPAQDPINGIVSCTATLTQDGDNVIGNATVVTTDDNPVKGLVVCSTNDKKMGALVPSKDKENASIVIDGVKGEGNYTIDSTASLDGMSGDIHCIFYVVDKAIYDNDGKDASNKSLGGVGGAGVVCPLTADGTMAKSNGGASTESFGEGYTLKITK